MSYSNQVVLPVILDLTIAGKSENDVLLSYTVPSNLGFTLQKVITRVVAACGDTTSATVKVGKGTSSNFVELATTTALGVSAAIGTTKVDKIESVTGATNHFVAGDVLEFRTGDRKSVV